MKIKTLLLLPVSLILSTAGCAGIGPNATYYMGTTSFKYDPTYVSYMVQLGGHDIGSGFGGGVMTSPVKVGPQTVTWGETNSYKEHHAKNQVILTKEQLKGKKYLAVHLYPDDTVEITTSNNWPDPTEKGLKWQDEMRRNK